MSEADTRRVGRPTTSNPRRFDKVEAGERIRRMRLDRKLLLEDLSRLLSQRFSPASPQAISKWERGITVPSIDHFCDLCDIFGCTLDELVRGTADQPFFFWPPFALQTGGAVIKWGE